MRIKIIFSKNKWTFQEAGFRESSKELSSPGRGWYQIHGFDISREPDLTETTYSLSRKERLVLVVIDIGACRDRAVTEEELARVRTILEFFAGEKKDMILRFAYDQEGKGMEHEPSSFGQVEQHMRQFGPVIVPYAVHILVLQGLFVGSWGEMHSSRFVDERHLRKLSDLLWETTEGACCLAVRKPVQWRMLTSEEEAKSKSPDRQIALYDDALFASDTHLGTFAEEGTQETGWKYPWDPQREYAFLDTYLSRLPNGGEAVSGAEVSAQEVLDVLQRMHLCYLNSAYDPALLQTWKEMASPGRYPELSLYEEIGRRLGYRFVVERAQVTRAGLSQKKARLCRIEAEIRNVGFGSLTQEAKLLLLIRHADGTESQIPVEADARAWDSQTVSRVAVEIEEGRLRFGDSLKLQEGQTQKKSILSLTLRRVCDDQVIPFANENGSERVRLGTLEWTE